LNVLGYIAFCLLLLFAQWELEGEDWPRWRGSQGNGTWSGPDLSRTLPSDGLNLKWKLPISSGYSGVTASNGLAYLMDKPSIRELGEQERVLCVDIETGKLVWEYKYFVEYKNLDYGKGPRSSLTIEKDKVYGLGAMGHAFCLDSKSGKKVWFRNLLDDENCTRPIWGFSASPEPYGNLILYHIGSSSGSIIALDPEEGRTIWRTGSDQGPGYAPPLPIAHKGNRLIICWGPNKIMGLPISGGPEHWNFPYKVKYGVSIAKPIFEESIILVCGYWNGSRAIKLGDSIDEVNLLWSEEEKIRGLMAQPLYREGVVYLLDRSNGLTAFLLKSGKILWRDNHQLTAAGRNPHASLVWVQPNGHDALALNAEGELVFLSLNADGYKEYWREQVIGKTWAHPAYSGNLVLVRDDRSILCWELPVESKKVFNSPY
jgi:outer membrane protein assembly factor BamB